jgi:mRNA-degrading endonuclease RelE of RelBE toxin-antitoxin system
MRRKPKPPAGAAAAGQKSSLEGAFQLRFTPDAAADIRGLDGSVRNQLRNVLEKKLAVNPEGYGLPLRGALANFWKHEFANHRVIYRIYPQLRVVAICAVGIRKQGDAADIYRQLESVAKSGRLAEQLASVLKKILPET